jgi:hypothetical protein
MGDEKNDGFPPSCLLIDTLYASSLFLDATVVLVNVLVVVEKGRVHLSQVGPKRSKSAASPLSRFFTSHSLSTSQLHTQNNNGRPRSSDSRRPCPHSSRVRPPSPLPFSSFPLFSTTTAWTDFFLRRLSLCSGAVGMGVIGSLGTFPLPCIEVVPTLES